MNGQPAHEQPVPRGGGTVLHVGSDWVTILPGRLVVNAATEMDGWDVRVARKNRILFQGAAWEVVSKSPGRQGTLRYELAPYPENTNDLPGPDIPYGDDVARQRDEHIALEGRRNVQTLGLLVVLPIVGLLWSSTKERLSQTHHIEPRAATRWSLIAQWLIVLAGGTLGPIAMYAGRFTNPVSRAAFFGWLILLVVDAVARYNTLLAEDAVPPGFLQWLGRQKGV